MGTVRETEWGQSEKQNEMLAFYQYTLQAPFFFLAQSKVLPVKTSYASLTELIEEGLSGMRWE